MVAISFSHITTMWLFFWYDFSNDAKNFVVMYKVQMFQDALKAVVEETEVSSELILSGCKQEDVIDARAILIKLLRDMGFYPIQISKITGLNSRSVNLFLLGFGERINSRKIMRINYERLRNNLGMTQEYSPS